MIKKIYVIFLIFNIASVSMMTTTITAFTRDQNTDDMVYFDHDIVLQNIPSKTSPFEMGNVYQEHMGSNDLKELILDQRMFTALRLVFLHLNETKY